MANPGTLYDWIQRLPEGGRYTFARAEAERVTEASPGAVRATLGRLKKRGDIVCPRRGFYVVVPREYRVSGCPPASWFIDDLMQHLGRPYYVALLSAAALWGAGHQQPMAFQVITDSVERNMKSGRVRIEFHASRLFEDAAITAMQTETGMMTVATAETTALDLVRFPWAAGGWSHIATVLTELGEHLDGERLARGSMRIARSEVQRLGWLLDFLDEKRLAHALATALEGRRLVPTPLNPRRDDRVAEFDARWQILVNDEVEPDL